MLRRAGISGSGGEREHGREMMEEVMDGDLLVGIAVVAIALFVVFGLPGILRRRKAAAIVVDETQFGLRVRNGEVVELLKPGRYSTWMNNDEIELQTRREQSVTIGGQEVLTSDNLPVRAALILRYRIVDPKAYRAGAQFPPTLLYEDAQIVLREKAATLTLDEVLADRSALVAGFAEALAARAAQLGMEVCDVLLRDLTASGAAKQAFADIWKAQKEGQAALERARGEQASLRSLANAARMLKGNPELMNLRLLQTLSGSGGKPPPTIVLGGASGLMPVSPEQAPDASDENN